KRSAAGLVALIASAAAFLGLLAVFLELLPPLLIPLPAAVGDFAGRGPQLRRRHHRPFEGDAPDVGRAQVAVAEIGSGRVQALHLGPIKRRALEIRSMGGRAAQVDITKVPP